MRVIEVETRCPVSAEQFWKLKATVDFERFAAGMDSRTIEVESERHSSDHAGNELVTRVTKTRFGRNPVPRALRSLIDARLLVPITTSKWNARKCDKANRCEFEVAVPAFKSFRASGHQWVSADSECSCTVFTIAEVRCEAVAVGRVVEHIVADTMQKNFSTYAERVPVFLEKNPQIASGAPQAPLEIDQACQTDPEELGNARCAGCLSALSSLRFGYRRLAGPPRPRCRAR